MAAEPKSQTPPLHRDENWKRLYDPVLGAATRALVVSHLGLVAAFAVSLLGATVLSYAIGFVIAVAVQTRLAVFMHEGAHWLVHSNKRRNDVLTDWLAAFPIGTTVDTYRRNHLRHHTNLGTPEDPDFVALCLPPMQHGLLASIVGCLSGWRHAQLFLKYVDQRPDGGERSGSGTSASIIGRLVWQAALFGTTLVAGQPWVYVVVWVLPLVTCGVLINELRSIIEHTPLATRAAAGAVEALEPITRTVRAGWPGRTWIGPLNFHYHLEHHLYPGVPFSRLPELHAVLVERGYYAERPELLYDGYGSILWALWRRFRRAHQRPRITVENGVHVAHGA